MVNKLAMADLMIWLPETKCERIPFAPTFKDLVQQTTVKVSFFFREKKTKISTKSAYFGNGKFRIFFRSFFFFFAKKNRRQFS